MKILHTSDWHFGMPLGTMNYIEDQRYFRDQLISIIKAENVEAVICAGDVYDSSVTNADAIKLYNDTFTEICGKLGVTAIVIAGNHDSGPRLSACGELLKKSGLYVSGRLTRNIEPVVLDSGKVCVYPIPFFNRDEVAALFPEKADEIRSYETAFKIVCDNIREKTDKNAINIVVAHSLIVNAELSLSDRSARVGLATAVSKDVFDGFDYVALGHIHKPQTVTDTIRYSGSPIKYSFGTEEKQEKSVVIIDTGDMSKKTVALAQLHDRKTVVGKYDEIISHTEYADCYLSVELTDKYAGPQIYSDLKEKFPFLIELKGIGIDERGAGSSLTAQELETLDENGIMKKFMEEVFEYSPDERRTQLFSSALEAVERGDGLQ